MDELSPEIQPSLFSPNNEERPARIKLIGVGGAGSNAADRLRLVNLEHVDLAVVNTDSQALAGSVMTEKLLLGRGVTRGLSAGGDPELGRLAAESDRADIASIVRDYDLVVIVAGMGGGTGSGAAPVVAEVASDAGALVIAFVTLPFTAEGSRRGKQAEEGLVALRAVADAVIPLPNDNLLQEKDADTSVLQALSRGDEWIDRGVRSIWGILHRSGLINLDFASLREVFSCRGGKSLFGLGYGEGEDPVDAALEDLRECPLLHTPEFSRKADRLLVNIVGGPDLSLSDVQHVMSVVRESFGRDPHIAMGAVIDESWTQKVEICVIGTTDINSRSSRRLPRRTGRSAETERKLEIVEAARKDARAIKRDAELATTSHRVVPGSNPVTPKAPVQQGEFSFAETESRGRFERSDGTFFEGEDLDVPTYRRRGIRIAF